MGVPINDHWCIADYCEHGTLNGSLVLGSLLLAEYQKGYKAGFQDAQTDNTYTSTVVTCPHCGGKYTSLAKYLFRPINWTILEKAIRAYICGPDELPHHLTIAEFSNDVAREYELLSEKL